MTSYQARLLLASSSRRKVWLAVLSINEASTTPTISLLDTNTDSPNN